MKQTIQHILMHLFSLGALFLVSCVTKPTQSVESYVNAQWETKAVIKNLKEGRTNSLKIDILGVRDAKARFEISALFGIQIASLVMTPRDIRYVLYSDKKFFFGKNSEKAFAKLIDLPIHPMNLAYIAFDQHIHGPNWVCQNDAAGAIEKCAYPSKSVEVRWLNRDQGAKRVLITAPNFEMNWVFSEPKTSVQFKPETFTLSQPEGFKAIQLY